MPRQPLIRSDIHPYHVTARTIDQQFFPLSQHRMWQIFTDELYRANKKHQLAIHAFVLMGNHFHLLCHTPKSNLDQAMHLILRNSAIKVGKRLWGERYRWSMIQSRAHYYQVYKYMMQNPLRAKLVKKVEDYPYSTHRTFVSFPLHSHVPMRFGGSAGEALWLNELFTPDDEKLIRLGLRKCYFDITQRKAKKFLTLPDPDNLTMDEQGGIGLK